VTMTVQSHSDLHQDQGPTLGRHDPILQELWETKASLNAGASYSVARLAELAEAFDLDATLIRLRQEANH